MNLIKNHPDIDKICLYGKNPYEGKYQFLIKKRESTGLKHFTDPKAFIEYQNDMEDTYKNIEECNLGKKRKTLLVFDDMIADMINNKNLNSIVTDFLIRARKLNISIVLLDYILPTFLSLKFQTKENFNKLP